MAVLESSIVVGLQWGNEGKGRIMGFLSNHADVIARFDGCSNGGRIFPTGGGHLRLNYLPCGINHKTKKCLICHGAALDLEKLSEEIAMAQEAGILKAHLTINPSCHLILDYHKKLDVLYERSFGLSHSMALRERGMVSCCFDKYNMLGIRAADLLYPEALHGKIRENLRIKNEYFTKIYDEKPLDADKLFSKCLLLGERIKPYIGDTSEIIDEAIAKNLIILFEGSNGALNDIDRGTYPFVMPLSSLSSSALSGSGMKWNSRVRILGVAKSYCSRTDIGPFITEESGPVAHFIRNRGDEFTWPAKLPRRIGWLDLPALRYALAENRAQVLAVTKLDVLTGIDELKICTSYILDGKERKSFIMPPEEMGRAKPIYKIMTGWKEDISSCCDFNSLPQSARAYIKFIEEETGIPVIWVGTGTEWYNALCVRN